MLIGFAFGVAVKWLLKWMRRRDAGRDQQICLTLAAAYLSFYIANSPAAVSGDAFSGFYQVSQPLNCSALSQHHP